MTLLPDAPQLIIHVISNYRTRQNVAIALV